MTSSMSTTAATPSLSISFSLTSATLESSSISPVSMRRFHSSRPSSSWFFSDFFLSLPSSHDQSQTFSDASPFLRTSCTALPGKCSLKAQNTLGLTSAIISSLSMTFPSSSLATSSTTALSSSRLTIL
eukprot:CAMPEP_0197567872 /NCGR_PEP_ID=MMETSP1320-20131121/36342_1 /TAXON_ID=91990 /ORGANISM="Bolidomonas sp., Strain RCC2347" /LENGTH=127 /DNA_ID=CAMNT_0043130109 /DNA_START=36 /DNA_END=415 /DNA_ORIENTATION=-